MAKVSWVAYFGGGGGRRQESFRGGGLMRELPIVELILVFQSVHRWAPPHQAGRSGDNTEDWIAGGYTPNWQPACGSGDKRIPR